MIILADEIHNEIHNSRGKNIPSTLYKTKLLSAPIIVVDKEDNRRQVSQRRNSTSVFALARFYLVQERLEKKLG